MTEEEKKKEHDRLNKKVSEYLRAHLDSEVKCEDKRAFEYKKTILESLLFVLDQ